MNPQQLISILRLRWKMMLGIFVLITGGTLGVNLLLPKVYVAETSLIIEFRSDPLIGSLMPSIAATAFLGTQSDIIRSDRVAAKVVQLLGMDRHAESLDSWREETEGKVPMDRYFGELLLNNLSVQGGRYSNVVTVSYGSQDPKFAAAAANAFAQAYISTSSTLRTEPAKDFAEYYESQSESLRKQLEEAQAKLTAYQSKHGIVASPQRIDAESARLESLNIQLAEAMAQRTELAARQRDSGIETSPDIQDSQAVQGLKSQLATAESKLAEISSVVGARHPQRVLLEAQISSLRDQLGNEMRRVSGATASISRQSGQKVAELRSMVEQQKRTVLSMRSQLDEISNLQRDVETAQKAYFTVADRRNQLSLEGKSEQSNARVISPAIEPLEPAKPRVLVNVMLSAALGIVLAIAVALGLEMLDRRVREASDLNYIEGIPLLGVISPTAKRGSRAAVPIALMRPRARPAPQLTMNGESS